jgi:hypothetical protein
MLTKANIEKLDRLLLERFGDKVGRGLAVEVCRRREYLNVRKSLFGPVLTVCSQDSETRSRTGHNARYKLMFVVERREYRAWT